MGAAVFNHIVDAVDIETVLLCESEAEAKRLAMELLKELGFKRGDIIALEFTGISARVRLRGNVYKPADRYGWLKQ
jgi:hypothetical protein